MDAMAFYAANPHPHSTCTANGKSRHLQFGALGPLLTCFQRRMTWLSVRPGMSAATPTQLTSPSAPVFAATASFSRTSSSAWHQPILHCKLA